MPETASPVARSIHRSHLARSVLACFAAAWSTVGLSAAPVDEAGSAQSAIDETFEERSLVTLVEVPVNVVDRDGEPIRGLTKNDFRLWDHGDEQEIAGLEVVDLQVAEPAPGERRSKKDIRETRERDLERLPSSARRHFLLLFDLGFSRPGNILEARDAARDFVLDHLHPTDLAAVATFSMEKGPQLLVTFTPDRAQVARAIDTLGAPALLGETPGDPLRFVIDDLTGGESVASANDVDADSNLAQHLDVVRFQQQRANKTFERQRISGWSRALADVARALAALDGRKHVVYFSEGFDGSLLLGQDASRPGSAANSRSQQLRESNALWLIDQDDTFGHRGLQGDVADMLEEFRRADATIQAVDIAGLRVDTSVDGMSGNMVAGGLNDAQDALFYIADGTGGTLFENANDLGTQLERVLRRNSVTYVLRYYPSELELDGEYHRLKVKADLPRGARISHRAGYYAPRSWNELHPLEKALLTSEAIASATPRDDLGLEILAAPFRSGTEKAYVPVILEIEGRSLLAGHRDASLALEIYVYATNSRGEIRDFLTQVVSFDLEKTRQALFDTGVKYYGHLDLPPEDYLLRVLVRNGQTGSTAVATREVNVADAGEPGPVVLPPFFPEAPNQWFMVREQVTDPSQGVVYPFVLGSDPYVPSARAVLAPDQDARLYLMAYDLGDGPLELRGRIVEEKRLGDGASARADRSPRPPGALDLVERVETATTGLDTLVASYDPQGLEAGEYLLEVTVENRRTGESRSSSVPIRIR